MTFLKEQLQQLRRFYREDFLYFLRISAAAFLVIIVGSYVLGKLVPDFAARYVEQFVQQVDDLGIVSENGTVPASFLFANNLRATFVTMVYGFLPLIYLPALSLGVNASLMGILAAYYTGQGVSLWYFLLGILPHGIFELPALALGVAMGLCLCRRTTLYLKQKTPGTVKAAFFDCLRVLLMQAAPLLLISAVVEAYITPLILNLFQ